MRMHMRMRACMCVSKSILISISRLCLEGTAGALFALANRPKARIRRAFSRISQRMFREMLVHARYVTSDLLDRR